MGGIDPNGAGDEILDGDEPMCRRRIRKLTAFQPDRHAAAEAGAGACRRVARSEWALQSDQWILTVLVMPRLV